jgi:hypothetical protein
MKEKDIKELSMTIIMIWPTKCINLLRKFLLGPQSHTSTAESISNSYQEFKSLMPDIDEQDEEEREEEF